MAISRLLNKIDTKSVQAEKISPETEEKLSEIEKHPEKYRVKNVIDELRQKKASGRACPKDQIWIAGKPGIQDSCFDVDRRLYVCSMTPMVFAILTEPAELVPWILKTVKGSSAESFAAPVFYTVYKKDDLSDDGYPFPCTARFELMNCFVDPCAAILGAYCVDSKNEMALWFSILKAYGKDRGKNWLSVLPIVQDFSFEFNFYRCFPALSTCVDPVKLVELLLYIKKRDSAMYVEMMSAFVYISALICGLDNAGDRNSFTDNMKRLYLDEFGDEKMFWNIFLKKRASHTNDAFMWNPFGSPDNDHPYAGVWKKITGRKLFLDADALDLGVLYLDAEDSSGAIPPFGFNHNEYITDEGMLTGYLLMDLVRNAEMAVYGKYPGKAVFDMKYILKEGTEELVLMALKKDFIRKEDMDVCFRYIKEMGKRGIAPALVLKQNGEWPSHYEGERIAKSVKRRRKIYE